MDSTTMTLADDKELKSASEEAAGASGADYDTWFIQQVEEGLGDAEAGKVISSEEVERYFAVQRAEIRRKVSGSL